MGNFQIEFEKEAQVLLNLKSFSFSVAINNLDSITFDLEGRLLGAFLNGINYRRGLDNRVLKKWSEYKNNRRKRMREILSEKNKKQLFQSINEILNKIESDKSDLQLDIPGNISKTWQFFKKCRDFDYEKSIEDSNKFHEVYKPVSILPPDRYYSLVLQITEGCSYNKCTFCNFYNDRKFRIKDPETVLSHIEDVNEFFGESLVLRQSIFLADANALIMPQKRLLKTLDLINDKYTIVTTDSRTGEILKRRRDGEIIFNGIYSFIDLFTGEYKDEKAFREMAEFGVKRVYIGLESGSESLLTFLNKPGAKRSMISAVNKIKASGVNVGVIILIGAGGSKYYDSHITETVELLNQMNLDSNDLIYFSDFYPQPDTEYVRLIENQNIQPLDYTSMEEQKKQIKEGLNLQNSSDAPQITEYDIREFIY